MITFLLILTKIFEVSFLLIIFFKQISDFLFFPKVVTLKLLYFAFLNKYLKNLSSLFKIILPPGTIFSIISDLASAIPLMSLKFSKCASQCL